uniref:Putative secreted protein n=1 Tax=Anopheles darlingi TaxID=43151 RepID=A0A2M4DIG0_ANODA
MLLLLVEPTAAVVLSVMVVPVALPAPPPPPPPAAIPESLPDEELTLGNSGESGCPPPVAFDGVAVLALLFDLESSACCDDAVEEDEG